MTDAADRTGQAAGRAEQDAAAAGAELARLGDEYFRLVHTVDPLSATQVGVTGFDGLLPDPSREGAARGAAQIAEIARRLEDIDVKVLSVPDLVSCAVLGQLAWGARSDLEHGLWEANVSAEGYASPSAMAFQSVPTALLRDAADAERYLGRLRGLGGYFDAITTRYQQAVRDGRPSTEAGTRQAIDQLAGHLGTEITVDALVAVPAPDGVDGVAFRDEAADVVEHQVRPAMRELMVGLERDMLPVARDDGHAGIRFVPGGPEGYLAAVRRHTTTDLSPEQIHQIGLDTLAALADEWAELGGRVLGTTDVQAILTRLREDQELRFHTAGDILRTVTDALGRAEHARDQWFPAYQIPDCVIEEIDPVEARNSALAYYRPPAAGGLRPGAHCIQTTNPHERYAYEYEALAFHESTPGHHLQMASAQTLDLPDFRRFLDAEVCGYVEGWGLYCERLADEMGLYTSDMQRLGMLSFDALRACRLVVDTGMHFYGWPRAQAIDFMWRNTATTRANIINEVNRYIGWPGQALAYMIGRREIRRLRDEAQRRLGDRFDIRAFHGAVLGNGAVPLGVLDELVTAWAEHGQ